MVKSKDNHFDQCHSLNIGITVFIPILPTISLQVTSRTGIVAQILVDNGFQGTVYNILGGINERKAAGSPTGEGLFPFF